MAKMKSGWMIIAKLNEDSFVFFYEREDMEMSLEEVLDKFYHEDYPEYLIGDSSEFPIEILSVGMPDNDGMVEIEISLMFNEYLFHRYFDRGHYTYEQFIKDIN